MLDKGYEPSNIETYHNSKPLVSSKEELTLKLLCDLAIRRLGKKIMCSEKLHARNERTAECNLLGLLKVFLCFY
jgi:hypothetical protein